MAKTQSSKSFSLTGVERTSELDEEEKEKQEVLKKRTNKLQGKSGKTVTLQDAAARFNAGKMAHEKGYIDFKTNDKVQTELSLKGMFGLNEDCVYRRKRDE